MAALEADEIVLRGRTVPALLAAKGAARFATLIDALYEHQANLVCAAETGPEALYPAGDASFEFARTASRLHEMQSDDDLSVPHLT